MIVRRPSRFIKPCLPLKVARPPSGSFWVHEINRGYRAGAYRGYRYGVGAAAVGAAVVGAAAAGAYYRGGCGHDAYGNWVCPPY
jgi:hypothetical protein